ncbi:hypothetical protein IQ64_44105 [Streptomyces stelliscabiei]|nr:hypothetical protein IQ64_44105 [Streptomyces stelliscabiei]
MKSVTARPAPAQRPFTAAVTTQELVAEGDFEVFTSDSELDDESPGGRGSGMLGADSGSAGCALGMLPLRSREERDYNGL